MRNSTRLRFNVDVMYAQLKSEFRSPLVCRKSLLQGPGENRLINSTKDTKACLEPAHDPSRDERQSLSMRNCIMQGRCS